MLLALLSASYVTAAAATLPTAAVAEPRVFDGRKGEIRVTPPRIESAVTIDGNLDEPAWGQAAVLTGFSQFAPSDGVPASDSTQVLVWYSPDALYLGVRAYERHGKVTARLAERDRIGSEDRVEFLLGTFNDRRQAYVFQVNPLGVQADGTLVEAAQAAVRPGSGNDLSGRQAPDLSADFVFQSRGRVTSYGYEVEIRIPFKSIRYQSARVQDWDFNVTRYVQHSGYDDTWAPARRGAASFLAQSGTLAGLTDLQRGLVLDVNPELTQTTPGEPGPDGRWRYAAGRTNLGGNVRWGVTSNLTLNATVRPDFSQVEADAGQLSFDPRNALFFEERRPFFLDGIEQFSVPNQLVYTRRIVQPTAAGKLTGTIRGTNIALLTAEDDRSTSLSGAGHPLFNIARLQRDIGSGARVGLLVTDREDGPDFNRVAGLDARALFRDIYTVQVQGAGSLTSLGGTRTDGPLWAARVARNGRTLGFDYRITGIDPGFQTASGFISRPGVTEAILTHRATHLGTPGALLENLTGSISLIGTWQYRAFTRRGDAQDKKLHFDFNASLRGDWELGAGLYTEVFGYDPALYANYRIVLPGGIGTAPDTVPFTGRPRIPNHDYLLRVRTPRGARLAGSVFVLFGQDENFYEWQQADILILRLEATWRPTERLRVRGTYAHQRFARRSDGSVVGERRIPRVKLEYQISRPIFVRLVGEYDAQTVAPLRDDGRTNAPIIVYDPSSGTYSPGGGVRSNRLRTQALFSYQPVPGTVFFAGYGALLAEPDAFRFRGITRESDGLFVKLSYLFRAG